MKRSEMLLKLRRYYSIRHCMIEMGHVTANQFMEEVLTLVEQLGMLPPFSENMISKNISKNTILDDTGSKKMKRKEALKIIENTIDMSLGCGDVPLLPPLNYLSERILQTLEEKGMLPPFSLDMMTKKYPMELINGFKWENENE